MPDSKQLLLAYLSQEGYAATLDGDAGILFKKEGQTFFSFPDPGDPNFFSLYSNFDFADRISSRTTALEAANTINRTIKAIKVSLPDIDHPARISFGVEVPLPLPESFPAIFDRALATIAYAVDQFAARLNEE